MLFLRRDFVRSIGSRFLLAAAAIVVAMMAGTSLLLEDNRTAIYDRAVHADENTILGLEHDVRHLVDTMDRAVRAAVLGTKLPDLATLPDAVRQAVLFDPVIGAEVFGSVSVANADGQIEYSSTPDPLLGVDVVDYPYFTAHRTNPDLGLLLTGPTFNQQDGHWALFLSRRVNRPDGTFAGVVVGSIRLDILQDMFNGLSTGPDDVVALFMTQGGLLVGKSGRAAQIDVDNDQGAIIRHMAMTSSGVYETRNHHGNTDRIYVFRQVGTYPLGILIGQSSAELYAGWFTRTVELASALCCLMLLAVGLSWHLCRQLRQRTDAERVARVYADEVRLLTDYASDLLLRLDWDGRCRFASPASETILGYPDHALVMRNWLDFVHPEDRVRLTDAILKPGGSSSATPVLRVQHQDGCWRQVEAHGRALPSGSGVIVVVRDVTRRIELEAKLLQAHRMEALGQLTAGVAHDFNNILQAQLGCLELLLDHLGEAAATEPWSLASQALELGERGARLTSQLRSFSRQQHLLPEAIPVSEFFSRLTETIGKAVQPRITLAPHVEAGTPTIFADRAHLESALLNLILNARDAMGGDGTIRIHATAGRTAGLDLAGAAHDVVLRVEDDGSGMEAATLARACEPFFTTKGNNGTGLGLSSVQGFIAQSGGALAIRSRPGQGTVVELRLPSATEESHGATCQPQAEYIGRLLLVDDAPDVLVTIGSFLRGVGFHVVPAWGAEVALEALREDGPFDCLVTDFAMPHMNGIALIDEARRIYPILPALIITAQTEESLVAELGQVWVLQKPFRRDALVRILQRIIAVPQIEISQLAIIEGV